MDVLGDRVLELGPKPEAGGAYRNFKLTRDSDGIAWLLFDRAEASANTLSADVIEELDQAGGAGKPSAPTALIVHSLGKNLRLHCRRRRQRVSRRHRSACRSRPPSAARTR